MTTNPNIQFHLEDGNGQNNSQNYNTNSLVCHLKLLLGRTDATNRRNRSLGTSRFQSRAHCSWADPEPEDTRTVRGMPATPKTLSCVCGFQDGVRQGNHETLYQQYQ